MMSSRLMKSLAPFRTFCFALVAVATLWPVATLAQWAASPGETVRNLFGPVQGERASMCRGACGLGCPSACKQRVTYECLDSERMMRVNTYICSTHQGCREHDDCLDRCTQNRAEGFVLRCLLPYRSRRGVWPAERDIVGGGGRPVRWSADPVRIYSRSARRA